MPDPFQQVGFCNVCLLSIQDYVGHNRHRNSMLTFGSMPCGLLLVVMTLESVGIFQATTDNW